MKDKARAIYLLNEIGKVIGKYIHVHPERFMLFEDLKELRKMVEESDNGTGTPENRNNSEESN